MTEFKWPRSSCGPQALWYIVGGDRDEYIKFWELFAYRTGWRPGKGTTVTAIAFMARVFGWAFCPFPLGENITLGQFCRDFPNKLVFVRVREHFLVIDHGTVVDPMNGNKPRLRRRITHCFTVQKEPK